LVADRGRLISPGQQESGGKYKTSRLTSCFIVTGFPAGSTLLTDRAVDVVVVRAGLAHGLETPIGSRRSQKLSVLLLKIAKGGIGRLAAERRAPELH
jgi:hypothetical protein